MPKLSAGLLPYRFAEDGSLAVLLVHPGGPFWKNKDAHAWSIPKGEYQDGEDPEQAADREFAEELGLPVPDGPRIDLGTIRQASGKYVRAWAVQAGHLVTDAVVSNRFEMEWPPKSGTMREFPEVDRAEWMTIARRRHPHGGGADGVALPAGGGTAGGPARPLSIGPLSSGGGFVPCGQLDGHGRGRSTRYRRRAHRVLGASARSDRDDPVAHETACALSPRDQHVVEDAA